MSANFNVQFRVNEKTQTRVIRLTDTSTSFTLAKGNFSVTFPDGSTRIKTDFNSPDITAPAGFIDILAVVDNNNNVITGAYKIDFAALNSSNTAFTATRTFDFNWTKPSNGIVNLSDVLIPEVKFQDTTSYSPIGSFSGTLIRTFSAAFPSTSEAAAVAPISTVSSGLIDIVTAGKYYDGTYNPSADILVNYTHSTNTWLTINYVQLFTRTFLIRKCPTQLELVVKINNYRALIDSYKEKNDTQFNILSEQYDLVIALYSHLITRYETSTQDGSEPVLRELLSILEPYATTYIPQLTRMLPFEIVPSGTNSFSISDGTNTDSIPLGSTLLFSSTNPSFTVNVSNNIVTYNPIFGTATNTFAQGNDSRFHSAVTIGTPNGLSLASQALSLALATTSASGAISAADKAKLDGIATGANVGTVTSIGISAPAAFSVTNSPVTSSGVINISAIGNPLQYITGAGALATLNTGVVPENGALYFTNARSRTAISVAGNLSYNSTTGVISYSTPSETDPVFIASVAFGITNTNVSNWNTAYGWGDHALAGYLTTSAAASAYQPLDADLTAIAAISATVGLIRKTAANTYSLDTNTYLTSFTETDPIYTASSWYTTTNNASNWNTAYGWGDHALVGYLTAITSSQVTTALGFTPENVANKGGINGYASLDGAGLIPSTQLPSYVDDVLEFADYASLPATGVTGKIYVTLDTNKIYRWSGTVYVEISSSAGGGGTWGSITGTLSNQTDLQSALDAKQNTLTLTTTGTSGAATLVGSTLNIPSYQGGVTSFNTRTGAITLTSGDVTTALGFTPVTNARTLTINGIAFDLTANRSWTIDGALPVGGTAGQILSKIDATNYNTVWIDNFASQLKHDVMLGATIAKGKAVYVSGANGTNMIVSLASNATEATSSKTLGLIETGGVTNDIVKVVTEGLLAGLNTSAATVGDPVWLGTNGDLIFGLANKPYAPAHLVFIGVVTRVQNNNGEIFVKPQNGFEMYELHNVSALNPANNAILAYNTTTSLWEKNTIVGTLGYTPYNATNPSSFIALTALSAGAGISYNNTTGVISSTITQYTDALARASISLTTTGTSGASTYNNTTGALNVPTYTLAGLGGITASFLSGGTGITYNSTTGVIATTITQYTDALARASVSGTAPITYNSSTGAIGITQASGSTDGFLSSTDWTTFNGKQNVITNPVTGTGTTNYIPKFTSSSVLGNSAIFNNGTSVGINTATPRASLDVSGNIYAGSVWIPDTTGSLLFGDLNAGASSTYIYGVGGNGVTNYLGFSTNGSEAMRILSTRQLRLNAYTSSTSFTGTAVASLAVDSSGNVITVATGGGTTINGTGFVKASGTTISYDNSTYLTTTSAASTYLALSGGTLTGSLNHNAGDQVDWYLKPPANGPTIRMRYSGGTTNRNAALGWMNNAPAFYDILYWDSANVTITNYLYVNASGTAGVNTGIITRDITAARGANEGVIYLGSNGSHYLYFDGSNYQLPAGGLVLGGNFTETSSIKYKENISTLEGALDKIINLRGVSYNRKGDKSIEIGVIAEEMYKVVPELVTLENNEINSVAYSRIGALLIEAVKEQQKQIEELKVLLAK